MKKRFAASAVLAAMSFASIALAGGPNQKTTPNICKDAKTHIIVGAAKIHDATDHDKIVGYLSKGATVTVISEAAGSWYKSAHDAQSLKPGKSLYTLDQHAG